MARGKGPELDIDDLISKGKERGYLSVDDIESYLGTADPAMVEAVDHVLLEEGIEVSSPMTKMAAQEDNTLDRELDELEAAGHVVNEDPLIVYARHRRCPPADRGTRG